MNHSLRLRILEGPYTYLGDQGQGESLQATLWGPNPPSSRGTGSGNYELSWGLDDFDAPQIQDGEVYQLEYRFTHRNQSRSRTGTIEIIPEATDPEEIVVDIQLLSLSSISPLLLIGGVYVGLYLLSKRKK